MKNMVIIGVILTSLLLITGLAVWRILWQHKPGKPVKTASESFQPIHERRPFNAEETMIEVNYRQIKFWIDKEEPRVPAEIAHQIETIIRNDQPPQRFDKTADIKLYYMTLAVPGQSGSAGGMSAETPLGYFTSFCVQIPHKPLYRFFVFNSPSHAGPWTQVSDFIYETAKFPSIHFSISGNWLICLDENQSMRVMHTKKISLEQP